MDLTEFDAQLKMLDETEAQAIAELQEGFTDLRTQLRERYADELEAAQLAEWAAYIVPAYRAVSESVIRGIIDRKGLSPRPHREGDSYGGNGGSQYTNLVRHVPGHEGHGAWVEAWGHAGHGGEDSSIGELEISIGLHMFEFTGEVRTADEMSGWELEYNPCPGPLYPPYSMDRRNGGHVYRMMPALIVSVVDDNGRLIKAQQIVEAIRSRIDELEQEVSEGKIPVPADAHMHR